VQTVKPICVAMARCAVAFATSLASAPTVRAADLASKFVVEAPATFTGDFGLRLWVGGAKTGKNLFDDTGSLLISRLTYDNHTVLNAEAFTRFDFNGGWYLKGYAGGGALWGGKLKDEDFAPVTDPYSATLSKQNNGSMIYGSVDAGIKWLRGPDFHVGAFVGYHILRQVVSAYGCTQVASNPDICPAGAIPDNINVITQTNDWQSLRVGLDASVNFDQRWRLNVDAAYLPYVHLSGTDAHWLRIGTAPGAFTGPVPDIGNGWGYQLDGFLSYRLNDWVDIGVGGRYWHMEANGFTHFEGHVVGVAAVPQVVKWKTDNIGVFFQTSVRLGPYPLFWTN